MPGVGERAPDFELSNQYGEPIRLPQLRGRIAVVVFYPFAFSGVCTSELGELRDNLEAFTAKDAHVLAVSVDSKYTLRAYAQSEDYGFDLLSDFWPHGDVARSYGVFNEAKGMAERGTFIIDRGGVIRYKVVSPLGQSRDLAEYLNALDELA